MLVNFLVMAACIMVVIMQNIVLHGVGNAGQHDQQC